MAMSIASPKDVPILEFICCYIYFKHLKRRLHLRSRHLDFADANLNLSKGVDRMLTGVFGLIDDRL